jgi:exopolysaccharide biosynthesis polyprenyl glycosylphosphotransferase
MGFSELSNQADRSIRSTRTSPTRSTIAVGAGRTAAPARVRSERGPSGSDVPAAPEVPTEAVAPPIAAKRLRSALVLADALTVLIGATFAFALWALATRPGGVTFRQHLLVFVAAYPLWLGSIVARKLLVARVIVQPAEELRRIWTAAAIASGLTVVMSFALGHQTLSRGWIALVMLCVGGALTIERSFARHVFWRLRKAGRATRRVAIIGTDTNAIRMMHMLQQDQSLGYSVVGYIGDEDIGDRGTCSRLGPLGATEELLGQHQCTGAIISLTAIDPTAVNWLARTLTDSGIHVALSTSLSDISLARLRPQSVDGRTMLYIEPTIRDGWRAYAKRLFDIVASATALVLALPVLIVSMIAIWVDTGGAVIFRQRRVGRDGVEFSMFKLRTMHHDAEARLHEVLDQNESDGPLFKASDDPRITKVGKFLRKWSIDEIPQFFNVLRGDMSFVGPRPALPREVAGWDTETADRLRVLPGITGLWQVAGRASASFNDYKRLDLYYVDNWSLAHDIVIVMKTFRAVISGRGAF